MFYCLVLLRAMLKENSITRYYSFILRYSLIPSQGFNDKRLFWKFKIIKKLWIKLFPEIKILIKNHENIFKKLQFLSASNNQLLSPLNSHQSVVEKTTKHRKNPPVNRQATKKFKFLHSLIRPWSDVWADYS